MKQWIVLLAVLPIVLLCVLQVAMDQRSDALQTMVTGEVASLCEEARARGGFSSELQDQFRRRLAERLQQAGVSVAPEAIEIRADEGPKYRQNTFEEEIQRGLIAYEIIVPTGMKMAGAHLFGITEEENRGVLRFSGTLASELLP